MKFAFLIHRAHTTALAKGWHENAVPSPERALSLCALAMAEIDEMWLDLDGRGRRTRIVWVEGHKPGGPLIELADVLIRVADMYGFFKWNPRDVTLEAWLAPGLPSFATHQLPRAILWLHSIIVRRFIEPIRITGEPDPGALAVLVAAAEVVAAALARIFNHPMTLVEALNVKLAYNDGRPYRHGGKLA